MTFTVITATWNSAATVARTVRSVMAQGISDVEHLIIDNESTDGTREVVTACGSPHVKIISGHDSGIYNAFNKGLTAATGDIVSFLNSDDYYLDGTLAAVAQAFGDHPEAGCVHGNIVVNGREIRPRCGILSFSGARIFHPACFIRRNILHEAGGFDESFRIVADLDLFLRIHPQTPFIHLDHPLTNFALGGASTRNVMANCAEVYHVLRKRGHHTFPALAIFLMEIGLGLPGHMKRLALGFARSHLQP